MRLQLGQALVAGVGDPGHAWISKRERGFSICILIGSGVTDPGYKVFPATRFSGPPYSAGTKLMCFQGWWSSRFGCQPRTEGWMRDLLR